MRSWLGISNCICSLGFSMVWIDGECGWCRFVGTHGLYLARVGWCRVDSRMGVDVEHGGELDGWHCFSSL